VHVLLLGFCAEVCLVFIIAVKLLTTKTLFSVMWKELVWPKPFARRYLATSLTALSTFSNYIDHLRRAIWIVLGKYECDIAQEAWTFPAIHSLARVQ
jgi:hypothetical protein